MTETQRLKIQWRLQAIQNEVDKYADACIGQKTPSTIVEVFVNQLIGILDKILSDIFATSL